MAIGSKGDRLYVMQIHGMAPVKVGVSKNPEERRKSIQTGAPTPVRLLWEASGGYPLERALHRRFAEYRTKGEWFDLTALGDPVAVVRAAALEIDPTCEEPPAAVAEAPKRPTWIGPRAAPAVHGPEIDGWLEPTFIRCHLIPGTSTLEPE